MHPFRGSLDGKQYIFDAPDGNVDRLTAVYQPEPVTLPETTRPGWSFGGWYYDSEFRRPAGGAGDSIIPSENTTLYAQWVDLTLLAKDNYKENEGKGAVDLSWEQTDHNNKTYLIYQRLEDGAWMRINSATDINSGAVYRTLRHKGDGGAGTGLRFLSGRMWGKCLRNILAAEGGTTDLCRGWSKRL